MTMLHPDTPSISVAPALRHPVVVMDGDGVGPEIIAAARTVLEAIAAPVELFDGAFDERRGLPDSDSMAALDAGAVLLKGPFATPAGGGRKSPNVTIRKGLELFANVRPSRTLPGLPQPYGPIDLLVVRENLEDLYAGVEHAQTPDVVQCLKLVSRSGSARIAATAFDLFETHGRKHITCVTKSNIMKLTDGVFVVACDTEADRRGIALAQLHVDAAACQMVMDPTSLDVIVTTNLYGDILSDLAAGLTGGLGLAPSMNLGERTAMFEAVHGTAPALAGLDKANPTALILSAAMLLRHIGDHHGAASIEAAVDDVYAAARVRTADVPHEDAAIVGCRAFAAAIAERAAHHRALDALRDAPDPKPAAERTAATMPTFSTPPVEAPQPARRIVGTDVFVEWNDGVDALADAAKLAADATQLGARLELISNRGLSVWPTKSSARLVDHFRLRFRVDNSDVDRRDVVELLAALDKHLAWTHVELLHEFDGREAFSGAYGTATT